MRSLFQKKKLYFRSIVLSRIFGSIFAESKCLTRVRFCAKTKPNIRLNSNFNILLILRIRKIKISDINCLSQVLFRLSLKALGNCNRAINGRVNSNSRRKKDFRSINSFELNIRQCFRRIRMFDETKILCEKKTEYVIEL